MNCRQTVQTPNQIPRRGGGCEIKRPLKISKAVMHEIRQSSINYRHFNYCTVYIELIDFADFLNSQEYTQVTSHFTERAYMTARVKTSDL